MLRFLTDLGIPTPNELHRAAEFVLTVGLRRAFEEEELDLEAVETLLDAARLEGVSFDADSLEMIIRKRFEQMAERLLQSPIDVTRLEKLEAATGLLGSLPLQVNLRKVQNYYYEILQDVYPAFVEKSDMGDEGARDWVTLFRDLGAKLYVRVD